MKGNVCRFAFVARRLLITERDVAFLFERKKQKKWHVTRSSGAVNFWLNRGSLAPKTLAGHKNLGVRTTRIVVTTVILNRPPLVPTAS